MEIFAVMWAILKFLGLAILIGLAAGVVIIILVCIIFILKEVAGTWKKGAGKKE